MNDADKKAWGTICAMCGDGPDPHNYRHQFRPLEVGILARHDKMKILDWMCDSLEGRGVLEDGDLHAANLPGVEAAISSWVRRVRQVLLPLIHTGKV